jgi:outer membrane receptor protein involved in Fe transport
VSQKTPPTHPIPVFKTEVLVTAERGIAPRDESAGAAAVLTRADIGRIPGHSLPALVAFLPGFHVLFGADFAGTPMMQSRGFFGGGEAEYVQLLVDGVPVGDAESGLVDWRRFRAWDIERIEARRGPSSSLYGDTSLGGVIQILTRTDVPRGGATVTGGSFGALSVDGGLSRKLAAATATITATGSRTNGFRSHSAAREGALIADKQLWATFHGVDVRGSRNPFNDPDYLVRVEQGAWYGWPDFYDGEPVTAARFNAPAKAKPTFLWKEHPPLAKPFATFTSHAAVSGLTFSPGGEFGFGGDAFLAEYGTFAPVTTGVNVLPAGFRVVRLDMKTREVHDFATNDLPGPAYLNQQNGFNRPVDVLFGPDRSLYVVDWGASTLNDTGLILVPGTGVVWRIYRDGQQTAARARDVQKRQWDARDSDWGRAAARRLGGGGVAEDANVISWSLRRTDGQQHANASH